MLGCCCSVAKLYLTLWDPMEYNTSGSSVLHYLLESAQIHLHWGSEASHPLPSPCPFASVLPSIRVFSSESTLCIRWPKYWSFSFSINIQGWFPLRQNALISLQSEGLSGVFSSTTVWKHQFFGTQSPVWSNFHTCTGLLEKT